MRRITPFIAIVGLSLLAGACAEQKVIRQQEATIAETAAAIEDVAQAQSELAQAEALGDPALIDQWEGELEKRVENVAVLEERSARLEAERQLAAQRDESAWNLLEIGGVVAASLGVPGIPAVLAGARHVRKKSLQEGLRSGASSVADVIAAGRRADPDFNRMFEGDGAAPTVMRGVLQAVPEVETIVRTSRRGDGRPDMNT